jgi:hypothetical protein
MKQSDLNKLKQSLEQTESIDSKYVIAIEEFKKHLKEILGNVEKFNEALNRKNMPGTIQMDYNYQK